jgi:hypothetical protein
VTCDFRGARRALPESFTEVDDVVATTAAETLAVVSSGPENVAGWLDVLEGQERRDALRTGPLSGTRRFGRSRDNAA